MLNSVLLEIMQNIGQLFLLRTNINSVGSVLDSPVRSIMNPQLPGLTNCFRKYSGYVRSLGAWHIHLNRRQSFPDLQPLYDAARSYLEIPQRVILLNSRVEVGCASFALPQTVDGFSSGRCSKICSSCLKSPYQVDTLNVLNKLSLS